MGNSCGKILQENLVGKSCGEILAGKSCRDRVEGKSQFKKGSDWWKFSIWNRVMGSPPIKIWLQKCIFHLGEIFLHNLELSLSNIS